MSGDNQPVSEENWKGIGKDEADELAPEATACPGCGERRIDWLVWQDDERVKCFTCGSEYEP